MSKKDKIEKFNKHLDEAMASGDFDSVKKECNDPELNSLLDKGQQINTAAAQSKKLSSEAFKENLYQKVLQSKKESKSMQTEKPVVKPKTKEPKENKIKQPRKFNFLSWL